jgi:hypothetical protein
MFFLWNDIATIRHEHSMLLKDYAIPRQVIGVKGEVLLVEQPSLKLNHTVFMTCLGIA